MMLKFFDLGSSLFSITLALCFQNHTIAVGPYEGRGSRIFLSDFTFRLVGFFFFSPTNTRQFFSSQGQSGQSAQGILMAMLVLRSMVSLFLLG